jgi:transposase-like protein
MGSIEAALAAIESIEPGELINYTEIANHYGVVRSTLLRRHRAVTRSRIAKGINQQKLNP